MTIKKKSLDKRKENGQNQVSKYKDTMPVKAYQFILDGFSLENCAKTMGISGTTFFKWMEKHPALKDAVDRAQAHKRGEGRNTFQDYVFGRLSPRARRTWNKIHKFELCRKENQIRALLAKRGKHIRQELFFHSLICSNFNVTAACRKVCLSPNQYRNWITSDPDFARLVSELNFLKSNFFESHLIKLVKDGDSAATIFASRTFNRHLGYNDKHDIDIQITQKTSNPLMEAIEAMPVEERIPLLAAIKKQRELKEASMDRMELLDMSEKNEDIKQIVGEKKR